MALAGVVLPPMTPTSLPAHSSAPRIAARAAAACAAVGNILYIAGGQTADGTLLNELVSFDASTGAVKSLSPMPYGRWAGLLPAVRIFAQSVS